MKPYRILLLSVVVASVMTGGRVAAQDPMTSCLKKDFDLGGRRSEETHYYKMESKVTQFAPDGKPQEVTTRRLFLECTPKSGSGADDLICKCKRLSIQQGNVSPVTIPGLEGWTYTFRRTKTGLDEKGQVFGIDHAKFDSLSDSQGKALTQVQSYSAYNSFIDFHSFCNELAERTTDGNGIQDLRHVGDRIVHSAAHSEAPTNLGSQFLKGSSFKNGEITLEFKGIGMIDHAACALVEFDSGESSFKMIMRPMPDFEVTTMGGSHYSGDLYVDLASNWVRKVVVRELVASETTLPTPPQKIGSVIERTCVVMAVGREEFERN